MRTAPPLLLLAGLALLGGCSEDPRLDLPRIDRLVPAPATPGEPLVVAGAGFGAALGAVAVGGRPVPVEAWGPDQITLRLPADLASGEALVVVTTAARARTAPAPLRILGAARRLEPPRRFPDAGPPRDARPPPPDLGPEDGGPPPPPDQAPRPLAATFTPDPGGDDAISIQAEEGAPGRLQLALRVPPALARGASGVTAHLSYDPNLLAFEQVAPAEGPDVLAREIAPGRLALMRAAPPSRALVLTFRLVGPGEGRLELPARHRALRDRQNADQAELRWAGGSVRIQPEAP